MAKNQRQKTNQWLPGTGNREDLSTDGYGGIWGEVMELYYILIIVVVTSPCTSVKTHRPAG